MKWIIICSLIGIQILIPFKILACPIPVFRYALEFWDSDPYRLEIFYKKSLSLSDNRLIDGLNQSIESRSNLIMRTVPFDAKNSSSVLSGISKTLTNEDFPLMVLRYPTMSGINSVLWSGSLSKSNIDKILNSPIRKDISNKLTANATAIWVFLESGNRRRDREALDLLNTELRRLEQTLVLPDFELWLDDYKNVSPENMPKIKFEVLSLSHDNPDEALFVNMLINIADIPDNSKTEPIVFPVYGRGLVLTAIPGQDLNVGVISEVAKFLTGYCSCQTKTLNPGVDLLISIDWDKVVFKIADESLSNPLNSMGDFNRRESEVKRQLEAAIFDRLGRKGNADHNRETGLKKLEFVNTNGQVELADLNTLKEGDSDKALESNETFNELVTANENIVTKEEITELVQNQKKQKSGINLFSGIFLGIIGIIFVSGIVLFVTNSKF